MPRRSRVSSWFHVNGTAPCQRFAMGSALRELEEAATRFDSPPSQARQPQAVPPGMPLLVPKQRYLVISSGSRCKSLPTSPVLMQIRKRMSPSLCLSEAMPHGRVPSIPARCGRQQPGISMPALTRVARMQGRFPASCCNRSGTNRGQQAVSSSPKQRSFNA